jgi:hypothetical protein
MACQGLSWYTKSVSSARPLVRVMLWSHPNKQANKTLNIFLDSQFELAMNDCFVIKFFMFFFGVKK